MARYTGPKTKISRIFGEPILGNGKWLNKNSNPPGQHGAARKRKSLGEYALQLREKQKAKYTYGVLERQFRRTFEEAVKQASRILIQHLMIITDENITFDNKEEKKEDLVDEQTLQLRKVLKTPLEDLDLSVRAFNCLKAAKINSLSELVQYEQEDLMKFRNFGQKSLAEIEQVLHERGLSFGMDLAKLGIDKED